MDTIISAVEEMVYSKKQDLKFQKEDLERSMKRIEDETEKLKKLEYELNDLKSQQRDI